MDVGRHLDFLGLNFEQFLGLILIQKATPKRPCFFSLELHFVLFQVFGIFILVSIRDIFLAVLAIGSPRVDYNFFSFPFRRATNK